MTEGRNEDLDSCPDNHKTFRFSVKKGKVKKKKFDFGLFNVVKELGPGNKNWFENATAQKIQQKKQKLEDNSVPLCTPKDKILSDQRYTPTSSSSKLSDNKFYSKIQRLLTSQTSTPSQTEGWQAPILGVSPDVVSGSTPQYKQLDIRKSLGVDMNDSMLSWTSSMATPTLMDSTYKGSPSPVTKPQKGLPRVLFSPGPSQTDEEVHALDNTSEENTDDDEPPPVPSKIRHTDHQKTGTLISPDITVFQNINQHELFNTDSELSKHFPKTNSEEKFNSNFQSFKGGNSVSEESSMPLFSQDLYMEDEIDEEHARMASTENKDSIQYTLKGNNTTTTKTIDSCEKGVSDALSDFFDPPSSAVGRRRCAPRRGKKRKLLEDSLDLEVDGDIKMSISTVKQSKKLQIDLLNSENRKDEQFKSELLEIKVEEQQENQVVIKSEVTEEKSDSPSLIIQHRKFTASIMEEDVCSENCSTPNNTQKVLRSILSNKKATNEGSAGKSNKKVRFCLEEKSLKRNLTQLDNEDYVSPVMFDKTSEDDTQSGRDLGIGHYIDTLAKSLGSSAQNDMSEPLLTHKTPSKESDVEMCDDLFSQVSPKSLNEMCSVATSVDKGGSTQGSNLETRPDETGLDKTKQKYELKIKEEPVSVKSEDRENVSLPVKTDEHKVTLPVHNEKDPVSRNVSSNPLRSSICMKSKPKKFLYPSTKQISKSCPKSVYGFAEQTEKNLRLTINTKHSSSKGSPQDNILIQQYSTKSNPREQPTHHRGMNRNIGFESFSSLANSGKLNSETDRSDVIPHQNVKPKKEEPEFNDLGLHIKLEVDDQPSKRNAPYTPRQQSDSEGHVKPFSLKTESCHLKHQQNYKRKDIEIKTEVPVDGKSNICGNIDKNVLRLDSDQVVPDNSRERKVSNLKSENTSLNRKTPLADMKTLPFEKQQAEIPTESIDNSVYVEGDTVNQVNNIVQKCTGFTSASGKSMALSEESLHKAKQVFVSVDCDAGIEDDSSLCFSDMNSLKKDKRLTVEDDQNKHEIKLPRRTCTISKAPVSDSGTTTSVNSSPESTNTTDFNRPAARNSLQGVNFEDMLESILRSKSSPEVSRYALQKNIGSKGGSHTGLNKSIGFRNSRFETAVSVMKVNDSNLSATVTTRGLQCKPKDTEGRCKSEHNVVTMEGFKTAGGKDLKLSNESLKKASALLDDIETQCPLTSSSFSEGINKVETDKNIKNSVECGMAGENSRKELRTLFHKEAQSQAHDTNTSNNSQNLDCRTGQNYASDGGIKIGEGVVKSGDSGLEMRDTTPSGNTAVTIGVHMGGQGLGIQSNDHMETGVTDKEMSGFISTREPNGETVHVKQPSSKLMTVAQKPAQMSDSSTENKTTLLKHDSDSQTQQCFSDSSIKKHLSLIGERVKETTAVSNEGVNKGSGLNGMDREKQEPSDTKMKKRALLIEDTSEGVNNVLDNDMSKRTDDFSIAAVKKPKLNDSSLKEGALVMDYVNTDESNTHEDVTEGDYSNAEKIAGIKATGEFGGFSTAGGKQLKVSSSSLKKAFSLVADVEEEAIVISKKTTVGDLSHESEFSASAGSKSVFENTDGFRGFSTAGGKKLKLSDASWKKAMSLVKDFDGGMIDYSNKSKVEASELDIIPNSSLEGKDSTEFDKAGGSGGFSTAGGFSAAGGLGGFSTAGGSSAGGGLGGFSTAGGKKLKLSDVSLKKAMSLVAGVDEDIGDISLKESDVASEMESATGARGEREELTGLSTAGGLGGFSTAGGRKLKLCESSLRKAMSIISDVDGEDNRPSEDGLEKLCSASTGFHTAGGKQFQLSKASIKKGMSVINKLDVEELKDSVPCDTNSIEIQKGKEKPENIEKDTNIIDMMSLSHRSGSGISRDSGLHPNNSRKSSSRFPPGANIPKGFRPFKPPKITKKPSTASSKQCLEITSKAEETKHNLIVDSKIDKTLPVSMEGVSGRELQTPSSVEISSKDIQQVGKEVKLQTDHLYIEGSSVDLPEDPRKVELHTNLNIVPGSRSGIQDKPTEAKHKPHRVTDELDNNKHSTIKVEKADQDIEPSIMDELFSEELESSQHFSPGSGKVLRSQRCRTPGDKGPDVLPSEEYEHFLDIEDIALCKASESHCDQIAHNKNVESQTLETTSEKDAAQSADIDIKSLTPIQCNGPVSLEDYPPAKQTGFSSFQTASRKKLSVSEEALKLAKQSVDNLPAESPKEHLELPIVDNLGKTIGDSGFKSASGNQISVSDIALSKAKQIMIDDCREPHHDIGNVKDEPVENSLDSEVLKCTSENEFNINEHMGTAQQSVDDYSSKVVNKLTDQQSLEFGGFQSASGKKVTVSEESLMKARQSISDWSSDASVESSSNKPVAIQKQPSHHVFPECAGFQSASGKKVDVSNKALVKARQNFRDWSSEVNNDQSNLIDRSTLDAGSIDPKGDKSSVTTKDDTLCEGVSFAGDHSEVKEEEWTVPKYHDFHGAGKTTKTGQENAAPCVQTDHLSLQEVMNSQYDFSQDDADCDVQGMVKKDDDTDDNTVLLESEKTKQQCIFDAIQTETSGKYTMSSPFPSILRKHATVSESSVMNTMETKTDVLCSPFQSASGKQVAISKSALENAKKTMESASENKENISKNVLKHGRQTLEDVNRLTFPGSSVENMNVSEIGAQDVGQTMKEVRTSPFQSASGKQVNLSTSALEHAKQTLEDSRSFMFEKSSEMKVNISENALLHKEETMQEVGFSPFQSASGKKVNISKNSLEQARQTLDEIMSSPFQSTADNIVSLPQTADNHSKNKTEEMKNSPFQSASGKKVCISDSALQHAKETLEDINSCPFQSVSGFKQVVSSEALKQARQTLSGTKGERENTTKESVVHSVGKLSNTAQCSPFQTAKGGKIEISESSLQHIRKTKEDVESCYRDVGEVRDSSLSCDNSACSVQQSDATKLDKVPRMKYQMIKEVSNIQEKPFPSSQHGGDSFITPSKQKQTLQKSSKNNVDHTTAKPPHPSRVISPCVSSRTDRQVFLDGMDHSLDEFCQPDDFLEEMEVTPKRKQVEEKAASSRSGMIKPMKSVPEAFTKDRQGTSCSLQACFSKSTPVQESVNSLRLTALSSSSTDVRKSQSTVKSSFMTPYKKSDTDPSGPGTNSGTCNTSDQVPRKPAPRFIPKCLSVHQTDFTISRTAVSPTKDKETGGGVQQKTERNKKSDDVDIVKLLEEARRHQAELLKAKEKTKVSPDPGRLYTIKTGNRRLRMRDVIKLQTRCESKLQDDVRLRLREVRAATAVQYKFYLPDFYTNFQGHVYVGDGAYLVPNDDLYAGKEELFSAFKTLPGVDSKLFSDIWFYNHYRWLVWKLAAYEVTSPDNFSGRALTPEVVMLQMKYRYDREIDNCQRSALKKILERDDAASKRMVLCVAGIHQESEQSLPTKQVVRSDPNKQITSSDKLEPQTCVELTDGWYSIRARLDIPLTDLVNKHRINIGDKLCISGAELIGSQDACTPLEAPASLALKLNANSTRPASWDARLGYQRDPRPLCISLSGLYGEGGPAGCIDVVLARKYPLMYMEKLNEGGCVFRTGQAEDRFQHQHQKRRQEEMEKLYNKLQTEFELEDAEEKRISKKKWTKKEVEHLQTGHEIYEAYSTSRQPDMIEEYLSDRQRELFMERRRQVQDEKRQKLHAEFQKAWQETSERTVIPLMKMKVVGCSRKDMDSKASSTVTVWRPTQDVLELTEGTRYKIFGMNASSSKSRYKQFDVQLSATRQTRFMPVNIDENLLDMIYEPREVLSVRDIRSRQALYGEADFVGMVVTVSTTDFTESGRHQEVVYAVDASGSILGIKFWGGLKSFSLEDVLSEGRLFCASNLMDKSVYRSSILPLLEASLECSIFTQTSQYPAQRKALERLKSVSADTQGFLEAAKEQLSAIKQQKKDDTKKFTPEKNCKQDVLDPLDSVLKTPLDGRSASSSTPSVGEESGIPPSKQGQAAYQARMSRLLNFGSPSPLSPLVSKISPSVSKEFKPPVLRRKSLGPNH